MFDYKSCKACEMIFGVYGKSRVFRTGGDEFVVMLEGKDFAEREALLSRLKEASENNTATENGGVVAAGMAVKRPDEGFLDVFCRADERMYAHKGELKEKRPGHNLR